jgi:hypothetical protein
LSSLLKFSVSFFLLFLPLSASGDNPYRVSSGASELGMGSVCVMKTGFWSSFQNQALLANNKTLAAGINYENRFNISQLGTRSAGILIPAGRASLGIIYSHFGYSAFSRQMAGVACGLPLSEKISAGIQADFFSERTSGEYYNYQIVTFEGGILVRPSDNISLGIHLFNPVPNSLRKSFLPSSLRVGGGIMLSRVLFAGAEAEMSSGTKLIIKSGFEYEPAKNIFLRGGFSSENTSFRVGFGYLIRSVRLDLAFATHYRLGITSAASIIYTIK